MYCMRCGYKLKEKDVYCPNCGSPIDNNQFNANQSKQIENNNIGEISNKKKSSKSVILIAVFVSIACILFDVVVIGGVFYLVGSVLNEYEEKEYITLGSEEIVSFFRYEKSASLCSFSENNSNSTNSVEFSICYYDDFIDDVDDYFDYLIDEYDYEDVYTRKDRKIVKSKGRYVIEIWVDYDDMSITYERYLGNGLNY